MRLDSVDLEILEAASYDEPWHILCGIVKDQFNDITELVPRIFELQKNGLIAGSHCVEPANKAVHRIAVKPGFR